LKPIREGPVYPEIRRALVLRLIRLNVSGTGLSKIAGS
jgi:hypothetical protein